MDALPARLLVDGSRCDGRGICALCCPDRITLDEWGFARIDSRPIEQSSVLARARRAVAACPEGALALVPVEARKPVGSAAASPGHGPATGAATSIAQRHGSSPRKSGNRWRISGRMVR